MDGRNTSCAAIVNFAWLFTASPKMCIRDSLSAAFCLGHCQNGVTIKVDDEIVTGLNADTFDGIFKEKVLDVLKPSEG